LYPHPVRLWHLSRTQQLHADGCLPLPARRALLSLLHLLPVPAPGQATLLLLPNYSILDDDIVSFRRSFSVIESTHNSRLIIEDCPVLESCAALTTSLTRIASHFARLPLPLSQIKRTQRPEAVGDRRWEQGTARESKVYDHIHRLVVVKGLDGQKTLFTTPSLSPLTHPV
jgi:hypothetical protein